MYCESDQASLCWDCDEKVHGANFLVAKHSRSLLCHVCNFPTPWMASGAELTPTVSVCESCVDFHNRKFEQGRDEFDEEGENQVVPWSFSSSSPPPMAESSSSSDEDRFSNSKRRLENADLHSDSSMLRKFRHNQNFAEGTYLVSMSTGFSLDSIKCSALWLSQCTTMSSALKPNSDVKPLSQITSLIASVAAIYSAFVEDSATTF
uniref:B box-type domain-containing protein n=1 Tax=Cannabis sativa TaxID=3483 RepID=A0A803QCP8_CANSA